MAPSLEWLVTPTQHGPSLWLMSGDVQAKPNSACTHDGRRDCVISRPLSLVGLPSIVIVGRPSGHLFSLDSHSSVDDCPDRRDADEGRRDVEPLHCKARLQLWQKVVADTASASESHHARVHVTTALKADPDTQVSSTLVWHIMQHIVLTEAGSSMMRSASSTSREELCVSPGQTQRCRRGRWQ